MKQMVVDAMVEAAMRWQAVTEIAIKGKNMDARNFARQRANFLERQHDKLRAYILSHMTETPWMPKGEDDGL